MSKIDELYISKSKMAPEYDKSQYYIGKISKVNFSGGIIQTENMTVLRQRLNNMDVLTPNTIGYLVVIDSTKGIFLGQVTEAYLNNSDLIHNAIVREQENILHPNLKVKIIGIFDNNHFKLPGESTIGLDDKVYVANKTIVKKYVKSIQIANCQDNDIFNLKFARLNSAIGNKVDFEITADNLLDHHLMIIGSTNSGKSTSALSILDKLHDKYGKFLIIDPTGEYKDSFLNNSDVDIKIIGKNLFFNTASFTDDQWVNLFHPNQNSQKVTLLDAIQKLKYKQVIINQGIDAYINDLKKEYEGTQFENIRKYLTLNKNYIDYGGCTLDELKIMRAEWEKENIGRNAFALEYLPDQIVADSLKYKSIKLGKEWREGFYLDTFTYGTNIWLIRKIKYYLSRYKLEQLFNTNDEMDISHILNNFIDGDNSLYIGLDNNEFPSVIGKIVIDYIGNYLLNNNSQNPFIFFVDEVHRYAKEVDDDGNYSSSLIDIAREGRKKGIFLILTTQSPKDVPSIILNQMGTLLVHRLVGINEITSINNFLDNNSIARLNNLDQGEAILTGINLIQPVDLKITQVENRKQYNQTPHIIDEKRRERLEIKQRARH